MKMTQNIILAASLLAASAASAITIDTVLVGDAANTADSTGYGAVGYDYHIGTYEVTNSQYAAFLNAKAKTDTHALYNTEMSSSSLGGITRSGAGTVGAPYNYTVKANFAAPSSLLPFIAAR